MFSGADPVEPTYAARSQRPAPGLPKRVSSGSATSAGKGNSTVTQPKTQDGPDWAILIARVRDDQDKAAFRVVFDHFAPRVRAFLLRSGADASLAEECTQEVMATLWHKAHLFDPTRASAATWIFTIARNRKIDAFRKQRRPEPEDLPWGPQEEPDQADALALQQESDNQDSRALV